MTPAGGGPAEPPAPGATEFDRAEERLRRTLCANPDDCAARLNLAILYERQHRWTDAAREWSAWLESDPRSQEAHLGLGLCHLQAGRPAEALRSFETVLGLNAGNEVALAGRQAALRLAGSAQKSPSRAVSGAGSPPSAPPAGDAVPAGIPEMEGAAAAALAAGDYEGLRRHCAGLTHLDPDHFVAWLDLGVASQQSGALEDAVFAYRRALRLQPDAYQPHLNLGIARHSCGDLSGAREAYEQALRREPGLETAIWNCALACEQSGDLGEAERHFARLTEVTPEWADAWFRLGFVRLKQGDYEGSIKAWESSLAVNSPWPEATLNLAIARFNVGDLAGAREAFESVLRLLPRSGSALRGLAAICVAQEEWDRAQALRTQLLDLGEVCPELTFNLALWHHDRGRVEEALRLYRAAVEEKPGFPEALLNLGCLLDDMGDTEAAAEAWRQVAERKSELVVRSAF